MTREWKPGDRFTLELEVTGWSGDWLECKTMSSARRAFPPSDMQYAKLIQPATQEPQKLDTSKPMRLKCSGELVEYIDRDEFKIVIRVESGYIEFANEDELENIPEPKIKGRREAVLLENGSVIWAGYCGDNCDIAIVGRAWVEIEAGDGMGGEL